MTYYGDSWFGPVAQCLTVGKISQYNSLYWEINGEKSKRFMPKDAENSNLTYGGETYNVHRLEDLIISYFQIIKYGN